MRETDDIRSSIAEFWKAVLFALLGFAVLVVYIFSSSALQWKQKQERLAVSTQQKELDKVGKISVYTFVNKWGDADDPTHQSRYVKQLELGKAYDVGQLKYFDVNDPETNKYGFDHILFETEDYDYANPIITIKYSNYIHVKYSLACEGSWLKSGEPQRGLKTGELLYILPDDSECTITENYDGWGEKYLTFQVPPNGQNDLEINIDSPIISDDLRPYNYITTERFGEQYENVPAEFADRTRKIYTSHVIVEGWKSDPKNRRGTAAPSTPELTVLIRIKYYDYWDLTKDEYDSIKYTVSHLADESYRGFSPKTTIEYVGLLTK